MTPEEYVSVALAAIVGIVVGFVISGIISKSNSKKNSAQKLTKNMIREWKIPPEWSNILMNDPIAFATKEYDKLMKLKEKNDEEDVNLQKEARKRLKQIEAIKAELVSLEDTPLNVAYLRELGLAPAMAKMTRLRKKAQKIVAVDLRYAHHEHFLFLVKSNSKLPGLIEEMEDSIIDIENERPHTKTLEFMERQVAGLTDDTESIKRVNDALGL